MVGTRLNPDVCQHVDRISRNVGTGTPARYVLWGIGGNPTSCLRLTAPGWTQGQRRVVCSLMMQAVMAQGTTHQRAHPGRDGSPWKAQGIPVRRTPYGKVYSKQPDEHGRRIVVRFPKQIETLKLHSGSSIIRERNQDDADILERKTSISQRKGNGTKCDRAAHPAKGKDS